MIAVIFEAQAREGQQDAYLSIAAALRPELDRFDGFISIERYQSLSDPGRILSLSWWRDEAAVAQWRRFEQHRAAQRAGRERDIPRLPSARCRGIARLRHVGPHAGAFPRDLRLRLWFYGTEPPRADSLGPHLVWTGLSP